MTLDDNIIDAYRTHDKTGPSCDTPEFRNLSDNFYTVYRRAVLRGLHNGSMQHNPDPMPDFWTKWSNLQHD